MKELLLSKYKNLGVEKKRIISNFFSLSTLEVINYLIPLITLPYLVRVLGPEKYGLVAFAQAFVTYFVIAVDYGFYLSAPRRISIFRDDIKKVSKIFSNILVIKFLFMLFASIIFISVIFSIGRFANDKLVFIFSFGNVIGDVFFPVWFFQGMEKMKLITALHFIAKLFFLVMIFLFIRLPADYFYVPIFHNTGLIIAGILSLYIIHKNFKIEMQLPTWTTIKNEIREEFHYFVSTISINVYTNSGTFILGLFANNTYVGYYSTAEKLIRAVQRILWAASQSIYPYINRLVTQSRESGLKFIKKLMIIFNGSFFFVSLLLFLFTRTIIDVVFGPQYNQSTGVLQILAFLPFIISIGNILGIQTMLSLGMVIAYSKLLFSAAALNIVLSIILANLYKHMGVACAVLLTELFIVIVAFLYLRRKQIKLLV